MALLRRSRNSAFDVAHCIQVFVQFLAIRATQSTAQLLCIRADQVEYTLPVTTPVRGFGDRLTLRGAEQPIENSGRISPGNPLFSRGKRLSHAACCALLRWLVSTVVRLRFSPVLDKSIMYG